MTTATADDVRALSDIVGPRAVVDGPDREPHLEEWRGRWRGETPLIVAPCETETLAQVVRYCAEHGLAVVPQGGNTGLVGGQVPRGEVLVSTKRMRQVRAVSADDFTLTAEAGVTLAEAQNAAEAVNRLLPLSIGAEGTCNIGGVLSTNAGGVNVIRYGNARDLVLGLEVVLPDGRVWHGLNSLRKNNTGYDLKHLFVGAEGTLGIITAAVLKLYPRPAETVTTLLGVPDAASAVRLLGLAQERSGGGAQSFELMNAATLDLVLTAFPDMRRPLESRSPFYVLAEFGAGTKGTLRGTVEGLLERAFEEALVTDGTIAESGAQADALWAIRHHATDAMKRDEQPCVKCDVSVPIRLVPDFLARADTVVERAAPGARVIAFGHVGDGNIHYDVLGPTGGDATDWRARMGEIERIVHDVTHDLGGSISAEHGIGQLKRDELAERKSPVELDLMRAIKSAIDPAGLMNPGKLLPAKSL